MVEEIEIKRKVYQVVEQLSDHCFKVERKGTYYLLKKFDDDREGFDNFVDCEHRLRVSGVTNPKCFLYDKKIRWAIIEYIEGDNCLYNLFCGELPENIIELLFKTFWYAKNDRLALDYSPINFVYSNGKLYYLPFKCDAYTNNEQFVQKDIRLWFFTKEYIKYCHSLGLSPDESKLKSDYEINKSIALMTVKYYR